MALSNFAVQLMIFQRRDLIPSEKLVALAALSFRNANSGRCNPPISSKEEDRESLCTRTGLSKQSVIRVLSSLVEKGVIVLDKCANRPSQINFVEGNTTRPQVDANGVTPCDSQGQTMLPRENSGVTPCDPAVTPCDSGVTPCDPQGNTMLPITDKEQISEQIREQTSSWQVQCKTDPTPTLPHLVPNLALTSEEVHQLTTSPKKAKKTAAKSPKTFKLPYDSIPDQWEELCKQVRPDLNPQRVFVSFRFYFTEGRGAGTMRSERGWSQSWSNWISREKEQTQAAKGASAPLPPHKDPNFHFDDDYYKKSLNPDGTVNWGF